MSHSLTLDLEIHPAHVEAVRRAMLDLVGKHLAYSAGPLMGRATDEALTYQVVFHRVDTVTLKAAGDLAQIASFGMVLPEGQ